MTAPSTTREVIAVEFISADGVFESPHHWHFPYFGEDMGAIVGGLTADTGALLLGRVTYEEFASSWPQRSDDEPGAAEMNHGRKYVVSTTLESADWENSTLISTNVAEEVRRLKEEPGGPIVVWGSGQLVRWLLGEGLLDRLHLFVHPIVVGEGKRLFEGASRTGLKAAEVRPLSLGTIYVAYEPDEPTAAAGGGES